MSTYDKMLEAIDSEIEIAIDTAESVHRQALERLQKADTLKENVSVLQRMRNTLKELIDQAKDDD